MEKIKIEVLHNEWIVIRELVERWIFLQTWPDEHYLEIATCAEMYHRFFKKIIFIKTGKVAFKLSELIALKRLLMNTPINTNDCETNILRNNIISKIHQKYPLK